MNQRFQQQFLRWWLGLNAAAFEGGAVAAKTFLTLAGANAAGLQVPTLDVRQAVYVFLGGAAYHFLDYLTKNPLPLPLVVPVVAVVPSTQTQAGDTGATQSSK